MSDPLPGQDLQRGIMPYLVSISILTLGVATICWAATPTPPPFEILREADQARGNLEGITWKVDITAEHGIDSNHMTLKIQARGFDINGITLEPPRQKGHKLLMLTNNMWFHKPDLSRPVPISQRQRMLGNASYGDVASTNYAYDYEATLLDEELVAEELCYVFELVALDKKTTYDQIKYWVSKDRHVGVKAEYFTVSGKRFKSAEMDYANNVDIEGVTRPFISEVRIFDELLSNDITYMRFDQPRIEPLADYIFNLNLFVK